MARGNGNDPAIVDPWNPPELIKWRARAKVVAFIDMLVSAICIGFFAAFLAMTVASQVMIQRDDACSSAWNIISEEADAKDIDFAYVRALLGGLTIIFVCGIFGKCVAIWTAIKLVQSAVMAKQKEDAKELTWLWRLLTLLGLLICPLLSSGFGVILYFLQLHLSYLSLIIAAITILVYDFLWRVVSFAIVNRFITEFNNVAVDVVDDAGQFHRTAGGSGRGGAKKASNQV